MSVVTVEMHYGSDWPECAEQQRGRWGRGFGYAIRVNGLKGDTLINFRTALSSQRMQEANNGRSISILLFPLQSGALETAQNGKPMGVVTDCLSALGEMGYKLVSCQTNKSERQGQQHEGSVWTLQQQQYFCQTN